MTTKGRILVVDDDRLVLATVTHGLAQAGYEVIDADNGDDAILLARQQRRRRRAGARRNPPAWRAAGRRAELSCRRRRCRCP